MWGMKTTLDIDDTILHQAKVVAAQRKISLKEMVTRGLVREMDSEPEDLLKNRKAAIERFLKVQARNTEPMAPLAREEIYVR
jgi:hypothetical protein